MYNYDNSVHITTILMRFHISVNLLGSIDAHYVPLVGILAPSVLPTSTIRALCLYMLVL